MVPFFNHEIQGFIMCHNANALIVYKNQAGLHPSHQWIPSAAPSIPMIPLIFVIIGCTFEKGANVFVGVTVYLIHCLMFYLTYTSRRQNTSNKDDKITRYFS